MASQKGCIICQQWRYEHQRMTLFTTLFPGPFHSVPRLVPGTRLQQVGVAVFLDFEVWEDPGLCLSTTQLLNKPKKIKKPSLCLAARQNNIFSVCEYIYHLVFCLIYCHECHKWMTNNPGWHNIVRDWLGSFVVVMRAMQVKFNCSSHPVQLSIQFRITCSVFSQSDVSIYGSSITSFVMVLKKKTFPRA